MQVRHEDLNDLPVVTDGRHINRRHIFIVYHLPGTSLQEKLDDLTVVVVGSPVQRCHFSIAKLLVGPGRLTVQRNELLFK